MAWRKLGAMGLILGLSLILACSGDNQQPAKKAGSSAQAPTAQAPAPGPAPADPAPLATAPPHQDPAKYLDLARSALGLNQDRKALGLTEQAAQSIWQRVPLSLGKAILVKEPARGYGIYQPRDNGQYLISGPDRPVFPGKGMPVYVYLEPIGYRVRALAGGQYELGLAMDVSLYDAKGKHLFSKHDFMKSHTVSHHFNREFFLNVTVSLKGAPPGKYKLVLTVKDLIGQQQTAVSLPIELALAPVDKK